MSKKKNKYYVVWEGAEPGIYDSWQQCQTQIMGFPGAKYKGFKTRQEAEYAYQHSYKDYYKTGEQTKPHQESKALFSHSKNNIIKDSWSVDGACSGNPGRMEYRGVHTDTGEEIFRVGPLRGGTNNIGEILAIVHALALLEKKEDTTTPLYTDSKTAMSWFKKKKINTKLAPTSYNKKVMELVQRAEHWMKSHHPPNKILKWDTENWGEIPADFGRK